MTIDIMQAIEIFEEEAEGIKYNYAKFDGPELVSLATIQLRDEEIARCEWAINLLHNSYAFQARNSP